MTLAAHMPVRLALVGAGYWGVKLARNIADSPHTELTAICDADAVRLAAAVRRHPGAVAAGLFADLLTEVDVDGVVLATPPCDHAWQAEAALRAGLHVLVEKPLALSTKDADRLCALADSQRRTLMTGHTFLFSEPVRVLRGLIERGELGRILYLSGQRLHLGAFRLDHSALWDLGPHDVSIISYLLGAAPFAVACRQFSLIGAPVEDVAFVTLEYPGGVVAQFQNSRLDPRKVRQLTVVGDRKMAVYDDTDPEWPIRVYDKGVERAELPMSVDDVEDGFGQFKFEVRSGDVWAPKVRAREPLREEIDHFAACVLNGTRPIADGPAGRDVVAVLEAAERSAADGGRRVDVEGRLVAHTAA